MNDPKLTRRELLVRGAGTVLAAGAAVAGGVYLHDPKGDAGLRKPSDATLRLKNYFADIDYPASNPRISIATESRVGYAHLFGRSQTISSRVGRAPRDPRVSSCLFKRSPRSFPPCRPCFLRASARRANDHLSQCGRFSTIEG